MNIERLEKLYVSIIHDVLRDRDLNNQVLPYDIRPLTDGLVVAGAAFPVSGRLDSTISDDDSLLAWTEFLSKAPEEVVERERLRLEGLEERRGRIDEILSRL